MAISWRIERLQKYIKTASKSKTCRTTRQTLCCIQVENTNTFISTQKRENFQHIPYHYIQHSMDYLFTRMHSMSLQYECK